MVLPHVFGCLFFVLLLVKLRDPRSLAWAAVFLPLLCADLSSFAARTDAAALKGLDDARETGVIPPDALDQMRGGAGGAPVAPENAGGDVEAPPLAPVVAPRRARRSRCPSRPSRPSCSTSCGPRRTPSTPSASPAPRPPSAPTSAAPRPRGPSRSCYFRSGPRRSRRPRSAGSAACSGGTWSAARASRTCGASAAASSTRRAGRGAAPPDAAPGAARAAAARDGDAAPAAAETPDDDDDDASRADDDEPDAAAKRAAAFACGFVARARAAVQPAPSRAKLDGDLTRPGASRSRGASTRTRRTAPRRPRLGPARLRRAEAASLAGDAYGALPALNVTAAFDSLCGALDKRDAKSSPTTDAILLPQFQQVVQIVVIEADDGLAEARAQLARQQLQGVFELSGAPRSMIGVEDDSVLVEALAMPTRLLKHSSTLYARAAVAPLDVDDALPPLGLQLPDLKAAAAPPDLDDAPETPRKPPRKVLEAPAAPEDDGAAAAGDGGAAPEVGDGDDDDDASPGRRRSRRSSTTRARGPRRAAAAPRRVARQDKHLCYVCCLARRNAVIMECGHGGLCFECGKSLAQRHPRTCQRPVAVKIFERF
ncbi:hypothetical protein JL720_9439 [Aureococcus anophagefferens]|nr:hypothetical protein JL720_9439 [Aureococcus anophagefferens]